MDIVLVPGLWLNASTWDAVTPALEAEGHRVTALTLPGMASRDTDRTGITVEHHIDAVVQAVDAASAPVLLVAHSAGCPVAHAAADRRPEKIARVVHVGGFPGADGEKLLEGLPEQNGEVPMPDWKEIGEEANIVDFDDDQLRRLHDEAIPVPVGVLNTPVALTNEARLKVPATLVCPEYSVSDLQDWITDGHLPEVSQLADVSFVDLGGGHWPQITQPEALAHVLLAEAEKTENRLEQEQS